MSYSLALVAADASNTHIPGVRALPISLSTLRILFSSRGSSEPKTNRSTDFPSLMPMIGNLDDSAPTPVP